MSAGPESRDLQDPIESILEFWFGVLPDDASLPDGAMRRWFQAGPALDPEIVSRFGALHARAAAGQLDGWAATPRGRLALVILLDQFSRHVHRGRPDAFAQDPRAQALVQEGLELGMDRPLRPLERMFFYVPLEHAEDLAMQERCVGLFHQLARDVPAPVRSLYESFLDPVSQHRDIVARFGRFPHRNQVLGRQSTAEELAFLEQPGSRF
jgi:uncharacterized protein (DUF924 family)